MISPYIQLYIYQQHFRFTFSFAKYLSYFHHFSLSAISMSPYIISIYVYIYPSYIHNIFPISSSYPLSIISPKYLLITSPFLHHISFSYILFLTNTIYPSYLLHWSPFCTSNLHNGLPYPSLIAAIFRPYLCHPKQNFRVFCSIIQDNDAYFCCLAMWSVSCWSTGSSTATPSSRVRRTPSLPTYPSNHTVDHRIRIRQKGM